MEPKKFTILGESGSGKTCYLIGMYMAMNNDSASIGYTILAQDAQIRRNLTSNYYKLEDDTRGTGRFPDTTDDVQKFNFNLQYAYETILPFEWIDYPGAFLDPTKVDTTDSKYKEVEKSIRESNTIFICIDGENLIKGDINTKIKCVKRKCAARINPYLGDLKEKLKREGSALPPICIIVTKYDLCASYVSMDEMRKIIEESFKSLFVSNDTSVAIVPVSLGNDIADDDYKGELDPVNIHLPILLGIHFALKEVIGESEYLMKLKDGDKNSMEREKIDEEDSFFLWRNDARIRILADNIASIKKEIEQLRETADIAKKNKARLLDKLKAINMIFNKGRWDNENRTADL